MTGLRKLAMLAGQNSPNKAAQEAGAKKINNTHTHTHTHARTRAQHRAVHVEHIKTGERTFHDQEGPHARFFLFEDVTAALAGRGWQGLQPRAEHLFASGMQRSAEKAMLLVREW